jgi:hypothetical protein
MPVTRRSFLNRAAGVVGGLAFADVLGLDHVLEARATQCAPTYRSQFDGSYCCCDNCGPTSSAMMRDMQSCGAYAPSAASMRVWYNRQRYGSDCGPASKSCTCRTGSCSGQTLCPGGTELYYQYKALTNPYDGGPKYATELHDTSGTCDLGAVSMATFALRLTPNTYDWSAVVEGQYSSDYIKCDTGSIAGHSIFVRYYSSTSGYLVYDPDNADGCTQPRWWPASAMQAFAYSWANDNKVHCILGKAVVTTPC